jgi:Protein of unknown function (DUF1203).
MTTFRVFPIPHSVAARIRKDKIDDFGHRTPVSNATETDNGPCRSCLALFAPGEQRILFSYAPNQHDHPYNEVGPIYVHAQECRPYTAYEKFPAELRKRRPLVLRCYADDGIMVGGELVGDRAVEDVIVNLFENTEVKFLHARTATVGCYIARIERA